MADIVVYGGSFAGVAAAAKAASNATNKTVVLIVPDTSGMLGGIGTAGGQNFFDIRKYKKNGVDTFAQQGTFSWWRSSLGQFYNTVSMSNLMKSDLAKYSDRLTIYYGYDIKSITHTSSPYKITSVTIKKLVRSTATSTKGYIVWGTQSLTLNGSVFIDASEDGRLTRMANFGGTVGRYDWPASKLETAETGTTGKARQQAATLMFKVTGVSPVSGSDAKYSKQNGVWGGSGGTSAYKTNATIVSFNNTYGSQGYSIKPFNIAQNGPGSAEYWINVLLVFNVDGRANYRDYGTTNYPTNMRSDYKHVDQAWVDARNFIKTNSAFLNALKCMPTLSNISLVTDSSGNPVVGEIMYLRETIHTAGSLTNSNGTENTNYGLTTNECHKVGSSPTTGTDSANYSTRIGLNYYWTDINAYSYSNLKKNGSYIWFDEVSRNLRGDLNTSQYPINTNSPGNPVYVPYNVLTTAYVSNLLIAGYAVGASSFAWSEVRVIPNLCVLGDAAGVAAAYAVNNGKQPLNFTQADISSVQSMLIAAGAKINK